MIMIMIMIIIIIIIIIIMIITIITVIIITVIFSNYSSSPNGLYVIAHEAEDPISYWLRAGAHD